jgi:hypothetical protein
MSKFSVPVLSLFLLLALPVTAASYDVIKVKAGATIKVVVTHQGAVPKNEIIKISEDLDYCGSTQEADVYLVDNSRVKNAVVWLDGIDKGNDTIIGSVKVAIDKCRIKPRVSVGFVGGGFTFFNSDEILHTVQMKMGLVYQKDVSDRPLAEGATIYNIALPTKGLAIRKPIKRWHRLSRYTGHINVRSNTHPWMSGYVFVFDHPYAGVTNSKGTIKLNDVPQGEYLLKVWHEGLGVKERKVRVGPNQVLEAKVSFGS